MEIIFVLIGILLLGIFTFLLIEHPYYLVSLFVFLTIYNFNLELPGPFDLRGLILFILFIRLTIFDIKNLELIKGLFSNNFFILLLLFSIYTVLVDIFSNISLLSIVKTFILNFMVLLLGFLTVMNGYLWKTIVLAILITGLFGIVDMVYSYSYKSVIYIRRIIDLIFSRQVGGMNHNMFGGLCAMALITTLTLFLNKYISKRNFILLTLLFGFGVILSTSRMSLLTVIATSLIILFTQHQSNFSLKKIVSVILAAASIFIIVSLSFSVILSTLNVNTKLVDKIYWRLLEEPQRLLDDDFQKFDPSGSIYEGSLTWRIGHTLRDVDVFFNQSANVILFGFGTGGYKKIGEIRFRGDDAFQYSAHNFYTNSATEHGIIGLILFLSFFLSLLFHYMKRIKMGILNPSLIYLLLYMIINTIGSDNSLRDVFGYLLFGCVIADLLLAERFRAERINTYPMEMHPA